MQKATAAKPSPISRSRVQTDKFPTAKVRATNKAQLKQYVGDECIGCANRLGECVCFD